MVFIIENPLNPLGVECGRRITKKSLLDGIERVKDRLGELYLVAPTETLSEEVLVAEIVRRPEQEDLLRVKLEILQAMLAASNSP